MRINKVLEKAKKTVSDYTGLSEKTIDESVEIVSDIINPFSTVENVKNIFSELDISKKTVSKYTRLSEASIDKVVNEGKKLVYDMTGVSAYKNFETAFSDNKEATAKVNSAYEILRINKDKCEKLLNEITDKEIQVVNSFDVVQELFEKIQNRPEFNDFPTEGFDIPQYNKEKIHEVSVGAGVLTAVGSSILLGSIGGWAAGAITTNMIAKLCVSGTGTAIKNLSGGAARNAILAKLGGGSIANGGGGIALGSNVLKGIKGINSIGLGILIVDIASNVVKSKTDRKMEQANLICENCIKSSKILNKVYSYSADFFESFKKVGVIYADRVNKLEKIIDSGKTDWNNYSDSEKKMVHNIVLAIQILYKMGETKLFPLKSEEIPMTVELSEKISEAKKENSDSEEIVIDFQVNDDAIIHTVFDTAENKVYKTIKYLNESAVNKSVQLGNDFADKI